MSEYSKEFLSKRANGRAVFSGEAGTEGLFNLLHDTGFFSVIPLDDTEVQARRNYAIQVLNDLGLLEDDELLKNVIRFWFQESRKFSGIPEPAVRKENP